METDLWRFCSNNVVNTGVGDSDHWGGGRKHVVEWLGSCVAVCTENA